MEIDASVLVIIAVVLVAMCIGVDFAVGVIAGVVLALCTQKSERFLGREILQPDQDVERDVARAVEMPYYPAWGQSAGYTQCYNPVATEFSPDPYRARTIDEKGSSIAQLRARDRKCTDGWLSKNANAYRKNFGDELEKAEHKRWWGNNEF